jgi:glycosyltransferase involved in cell wall biosynthesis
MEAFSVGILAVAPNVGGVSEIVDSSNGILLDKNFTPDELMTSIEAVLKNNGTLSAGAYSSWQASYNEEKNYSSFSVFILPSWLKRI